MNYANEQKSWDTFLNEIGLLNEQLLCVSNHCSDMRIYEKAESVVKTRRLTLSSSRGRINALIDEFSLLRDLELAGIQKIPRAISYAQIGEFEALECSKIPSLPICDPTLPKKKNTFHSLWEMLKFLFILNSKGFSHGDLHSHNIGMNVNGSLSCFDFDQALQAPPFSCFLRDWLGFTIDGCPSHCSVVDRMFFNQILKAKRKLFHVFGKKISARRNPLHNFRKRCDAVRNPKLLQLADAWELAQKSNASNPGSLSAYYSLDVDGIHFPGQRPWPLRWDAIHKNVDFRNKRFLELGCNMGLLSIHAKLSGAEMCHGVDIDLDITKAAKLVAKAFDSEIIFSNVDLDLHENWESKLSNYDVVSCLSVFYWIKDKPRLSKFLSGFKEIIFEGHATGKEDIEFVKSLGFSSVTTIAITERNRPLIHGTK